MRIELLDTVSNHVAASETVLLFGDSSLQDKTSEVILRQSIDIFVKQNDSLMVIKDIYILGMYL